MAPGILYIPYPGLIIPVRFTISISLLFIAIKANVVSFYQGFDWEPIPGHLLLTLTAVTNTVLAVISLALAAIRDEDKLSPRIRWNCAACGIIIRVGLFALTVVTTVVTAQAADEGHFRVIELVLAEVTLGLLLICLIVGMVRKLRALKVANAAGEEEVQKEIVKRAGYRSATHSTISTPQTLPSIMCNSPDGAIQSLSLDPLVHKVHLSSLSVASLKKPEDSFYEMMTMNSASPGNSQDGFSTDSYA